MYIIAIGWFYVTLLMALTETNVTAGILTFTFYGAAPLALFLWLFGTPERRRRMATRERMRARKLETEAKAVDSKASADD